MAVLAVYADFCIPVDNPLEELRVPVHDDVEGGTVAGKHVVLTRHILVLAHVLHTHEER